MAASFPWGPQPPFGKGMTLPFFKTAPTGLLSRLSERLALFPACRAHGRDSTRTACHPSGAVGCEVRRAERGGSPASGGHVNGGVEHTRPGLAEGQALGGAWPRTRLQ